MPRSSNEGDPQLKTPEAEGSRLPFVELLEARQKSVDSLLCVGLDPVMENIPASFSRKVIHKIINASEGVEFISKNKRSSYVLEGFDHEIINVTHPYVSAYKPNIAFYERYGGDGIAALRRVIAYIQEDVDRTIPVILDAKRADIGATNEGYAEMLEYMGADAITVNPYFGVEGKGALDPFLKLTDKGIVILCRTSNPEAKRTQDVIVIDEELGEVPYYIMIAHMAEKARQVNPNVAIVVGATVPEQLRRAREVFKGPILVPGLGKQGGMPEDLVGAFDENGLGVIANNSSAIIHASKGDDFAQAAGEASRKWRDDINEIRMPDVNKVIEEMTPAQHTVAEMMLTTQVDGKLTRRYGEPGDFTYVKDEGTFPMITIAQNEHEFAGAANLKDPQNPDIPLLAYFANLRGGAPEAYDLMAEAIVSKGISFKFDYVTGIPNTGNAIAKAFAAQTGIPYYDLLDKPTEGVDRQFVIKELGEDEKPDPGMKGLLIDDLITGSVTKVAAEDALVESGFEVAGHAVVYDREEGGMVEMSEREKNIVAAITATQLFAVALQRNDVSEEIYRKIMKRVNRIRIDRSSR